MNNYCIVNQKGKPLDSFFPNDCRVQLHFSSTRWKSFATYEEAAKHIDYIQTHANPKTQSTAMRLKVFYGIP